MKNFEEINKKEGGVRVRKKPEKINNKKRVVRKNKVDGNYHTQKKKRKKREHKQERKNKKKRKRKKKAIFVVHNKVTMMTISTEYFPICR